MDAKRKLATKKAKSSSNGLGFNPDVTGVALPGHKGGVYAISPYGAMPMTIRDFETQQSRFGKVKRLKGTKGYDV